MHVVMVGDYPRNLHQYSGGVEAVTLFLSQGLQQDYPDLKLEIVTLDRWGLGRRVVQHGRLTVHYLASSRLPGRLSIMDNIRRLRAEIIRLKPDLAHAHIAGKYAEAAASTGLPWVLTLHGIRFLEANIWQGFLSKYRGWFIKRDEFRAINKAPHVISISPFIQATFNGQIRGQVYDIENPIAETFFNLPPQAKPGQLLFVGRLIPRKGVHTLLRAFAKLHQRLPGVTLRLVGGGLSNNDPASYGQQLKQFVIKAGLTEAVTFLGELDETAILEEYTNCSALVLASVLETAPMVVMQAMAAGKPVISTDAGGARYLVEHGRSGLIVPTDDEAALAEALCQVLSDETMLQAMGRRGKEIAEQRFHTRVVAARTREVYYQVLGQTP
jgi:glycosyltransferase involved in cell wall biosynthesis